MCAGASAPVGADVNVPGVAPAVELRDVSFSYGCCHRILDGVSLALRAGEVTALVGPNGCGKSTTVRLISRALTPASGTVLVGGRDAASFGRKELAQRIAVLAQGGQVPNMQVEQLVMSGRYPHRALFAGTSDDDRRIVRAAMERAGCAQFAGADVARLSGGERQRVYLAMVLAQQAGVVVMDEPTTYLDVSACFDLMSLARELADDGIAVAMVLHDLNLALSCCDRIVVMAGGHVESFGTPDEVVADGAIERVFDVRLRAVDEPADEPGGASGARYWCLLPRR